MQQPSIVFISVLKVTDEQLTDVKRKAFEVPKTRITGRLLVLLFFNFSKNLGLLATDSSFTFLLGSHSA